MPKNKISVIAIWISVDEDKDTDKEGDDDKDIGTRMILASQFSRLSLEPCICPRCRSDITGRATDMEQFLRFIIVCQSLSSFVSSSMLWLFLAVPRQLNR